MGTGGLAPALSVVVRSRTPLQAIPDTLPEQPLPGGIAAVVRFFFHVPQWIQIGGAVFAGLLLVATLVVAWRFRREILAWLRTRQTALQVGLGAVVVVLVLAAAGFGKASWDYMQHDNDFCSGCHIMGPSFRRFTESEHATLQCHDCHRQSIFASARQLYLWVLDRPEEIGPHAPVPDRICAECHIQEDPGETWQRVSATAGHRIHLESDTAALARVMCVTCHGRSVHRFVPAAETCAQADCHARETTEIVLGEMTGIQTQLHCVTCHEFTAPVAEGVALDTAFGQIVPGESQCLGCHEMRAVLADLEPGREPHDARCGTCHDPHVQETPAAAIASCTEAGCHDAPEEATPFHRGLPDGVVGDCLRCHPAHAGAVDGADCGACHGQIPGARATGGEREETYAAASPPRAGPPRALGSPAFRHPPVPSGRPSRPIGTPTVSGARGGPAPSGPRTATARYQPEPLPVPGAIPAPPAADQERPEPFRHADHTGVACAECHVTEERHGQVTVGATDCFSCHHRGVRADRPGLTMAACTRCHEEAEVGPSTVRRTLRLDVWESPRERGLPFSHAEHVDVACDQCHRGPRLGAVESDCAACHEEHHQAAARCVACHPAPPDDAHTAAVHVEGCTGSSCHAEAPGGTAFATLRRARNLCLSCHRDMMDHEPGGACIECHLLPDRAAALRPGPREAP